MPASADRGRYMTAIYPLSTAQSSWRRVLRCEEDRWILSLHGYEGDHPPTDEAGFLEFARSLPQPQIYEAIREAEPPSPIHTFKIPTVRRLYWARSRIASTALSPPETPSVSSTRSLPKE